MPSSWTLHGTKPTSSSTATKERRNRRVILKLTSVSGKPKHKHREQFFKVQWETNTFQKNKTWRENFAEREIKFQEVAHFIGTDQKEALKLIQNYFHEEPAEILLRRLKHHSFSPANFGSFIAAWDWAIRCVSFPLLRRFRFFAHQRFLQQENKFTRNNHQNLC
jgi:hypothetical protein